ncbi:MAG: guanylate kinase [Alphaproteobacteria bacterium GM202ARS2]|nr:guanylate kinase [Alphaproteobacteria bacterium GM202ARS2]
MAKKEPTVNRRGLMLVVSSPSGAGKTSLSRALVAQENTTKHARIVFSISATTRKKRGQEKDGVDYHFLTQEQFDSLCRQKKFLEHALVFGHHYGTPREPVMQALTAEQDVLFDIDWQGAQQLRTLTHDVVSIFILPPSLSELRRRLSTRQTDTPQQMNRRLQQAEDDIQQWHNYDYVLINQDFDTTVRHMRTILHSERLKRHRQTHLQDTIAHLLAASQDS